MLKNKQTIWSLLLDAVLIFHSVGAALEVGCFGTEVSVGFDANFYSYPLGSELGFTQDYFTSGYKSKSKHVGLVKGVTNINFRGTSPPDMVPSVHQGEIYGHDITVSNFSLELTGWFLPPMTGQYSFTVIFPADAVSIQVGGKESCCGDFSKDIITSQIKLAGNQFGSTSATFSAYLVKNAYFPIRLFYVNSAGDYALTMKVLLPNWKVQDVFKNVYQLNIPHCEMLTSVSPPTPEVPVTDTSSASISVSSTDYTSSTHSPTSATQSSRKSSTTSSTDRSKLVTSHMSNRRSNAASKSSCCDSRVARPGISSVGTSLSASVLSSTTHSRYVDSTWLTHSIFSTRPVNSPAKSSTGLESSIPRSLSSKVFTETVSSSATKKSEPSCKSSLYASSVGSGARPASTSSRVKPNSRQDVSNTTSTASKTANEKSSSSRIQSERKDFSRTSSAFTTSSRCSNMFPSQSKSASSDMSASYTAKYPSSSSTILSSQDKASAISTRTSKSPVRSSALSSFHITSGSISRYESDIGWSSTRSRVPGSDFSSPSASSVQSVSTWKIHSSSMSSTATPASKSSTSPGSSATSGHPSSTVGNSSNMATDGVTSNVTASSATYSRVYMSSNTVSQSAPSTDTPASKSSMSPGSSATSGHPSSTVGNSSNMATDGVTSNVTASSATYSSVCMSFHTVSQSASNLPTGSWNSSRTSNRRSRRSATSSRSQESNFKSSLLDSWSRRTLTSDSSTTRSNYQSDVGNNVGSRSSTNSIIDTNVNPSAVSSQRLGFTSGGITSSIYCASYVQPTESYTTFADATIPPESSSTHPIRESRRHSSSGLALTNTGAATVPWTSIFKSVIIAIVLLFAL